VPFSSLLATILKFRTKPSVTIPNSRKCSFKFFFTACNKHNLWCLNSNQIDVMYICRISWNSLVFGIMEVSCSRSGPQVVDGQTT